MFKTRSYTRNVQSTYTGQIYTKGGTLYSIQSNNRGEFRWDLNHFTPYKGVNGPAPIESLTESISWDGNGKSTFHECFHHKSKCSWQYPDLYLKFDADRWARANPGVSSTGGSYYNESVANHRLNQLLSSVVTPVLPTGQVDWRAAYESLLDDIEGVMPSDVSIAVNIAEFAQVRNLVPGLSRSISNILNYVKGHPNKRIRTWKYLYDKTGKPIPWTGVQTTVELRSLKWSLRDLADTHLAISFGALPLAADVANWAFKLNDCLRHLDWYDRISDGKLRVFHASTPELSSSGPSSERTMDYGNRVYLWKTQKMSSIRGILNAWVRIHPKPADDRYAALARQVLGINVPLSVVWELIPFSFVADWFLPVGQLINRVEPRRLIGGLSVSCEVQTMTWSLTSLAEQIDEIYPRWVSSGYLTGRFSGSGKRVAKTSSYERRMGLPPLNWLPNRKSRFGVWQVLLSASLAAQKLIR